MNSTIRFSLFPWSQRYCLLSLHNNLSVRRATIRLSVMSVHRSTTTLSVMSVHRSTRKVSVMSVHRSTRKVSVMSVHRSTRKVSVMSVHRSTRKVSLMSVHRSTRKMYVMHIAHRLTTTLFAISIVHTLYPRSNDSIQVMSLIMKPYFNQNTGGVQH